MDDIATLATPIMIGAYFPESGWAGSANWKSISYNIKEITYTPLSDTNPKDITNPLGMKIGLPNRDQWAKQVMPYTHYSPEQMMNFD